MMHLPGLHKAGNIPFGRWFRMAALLVWGTLFSLSGQAFPVPAPSHDAKGEPSHVAASERGSQEALPPPAFSHSSGFYQEGFHLTLTTGEPGAIIYYTLDGSAPDPAAVGGTTYRYKNSWPMDLGSRLGEFLTGAFHTYMYRGPFPVTERSSDPDSLTHKATAYNTNYYFPDSPVFKGTIVRAMAIKEGFEPSQTITHVYFIHPEGRSRYHLPVISISINEDHLFDYEKGIYTPGEVFDAWRLNHPHDQADGGRPANYHRRGEEWEYPAHLTFFDAHSTRPDLSQDVGVRIHGAWTRSYPMKSLRIYARNAYGTSTLDHPFFPDYPHDSFKRLILRNSGNDWDRTMFRDAMIQEVIRPLKVETQAHQPAVLFINGEYWGMHNIRERFDKHYLHRVFGVEKDELDLLTHDAMIQEGGRVHYLNTLRFISDHDMASDVHFRIVQNRIDIENFIDYQVANIFAANTDWPGNNIDFWRKQTFTYEPESPYGHDGRWRWLAYDMDFGFGLVGHPPDHHTLAFATEAGNTGWPNPDWSTFLLRNLLQNEQFRHDFINRFADLLNTRFKTDSVLAVIDALQQRVEPQMPEHIHRWKRPPDMGNWNGHVAALRHFASNRPERQRQQLRSFFGLPGYAAIRLNVSGHDHGFIRLNTLELHFEPGENGQEPEPWTGRYFQEVPIRLEAIPKEGYVFSHWEGLAEGDSAMFIRDPSGLGSITAHFTKEEAMPLIHFWYFDTSLPNDHPMEFIEPAYSITGQARLNYHSALEGYPFNEESPFWRKASMERRNAPTPLNYQSRGNAMQPYDEEVMRGIQIKQPFRRDGRENTFVCHLPTTGFRDVVFRFAAMDEGAADRMAIDYSTANIADKSWSTEGVWTRLEMPDSLFLLSDEFRLFSADFSGIEAVNDNPHFSIRIRFTGSDMEADEGNRTSFNNISLEGWPLDQPGLPPQVIHNPGLLEVIERGEEVVIDLNDIFSAPGETPIAFSAETSSPDHVSFRLEGDLLTLNPLRRGDAIIEVAASDGTHDSVETSFRVLVYPAAFSFDEGDFFFGSWSAGEADCSYPEHMLFLQSDRSDPGVDAPLRFPYHVPHADYHGDDQERLGFPYSLSRRTRINALGTQGISFINTGRDRDLGGALLAIRTSGLSNLQVEWLAATVLLNSRTYALRLQYRLGHTGDFEDLLVNGEPMVYAAGQEGESLHTGPLSLPSRLLDKEYLQLLWRYHHVSGDSGPRSELRLDDIMIGPWVGIKKHPLPQASIYAAGQSIMIDIRDEGQAAVSVFTLQGRLVHTEQLPGYGVFPLGRSFRPGIFIVRLETPQGLYRQKIIVN
jgi:hypothetical protein